MSYLATAVSLNMFILRVYLIASILSRLIHRIWVVVVAESPGMSCLATAVPHVSLNLFILRVLLIASNLSHLGRR